jgi:hypothetical protein
MTLPSVTSIFPALYSVFHANRGSLHSHTTPGGRVMIADSNGLLDNMQKHDLETTKE